MSGGTVGEVVASRHPGLQPGDTSSAWAAGRSIARRREHARRAAQGRHDARFRSRPYLGAVGMPGVTAWYGLMKICQPKAGQTIVVSAASGAVGSAVGQLRRARGCRAVGIAGGADKCGYVTGELGFDACIDYKAHRDPKSLYAALKEATPDGVDGCFENVGGMVLDAVPGADEPFGRIALCGMISGYDGQPIPLQQPQLLLSSASRSRASSSASTWRSGRRR
jgi:NADPH-dependent curcumin reductase CurA